MRNPNTGSFKVGVGSELRLSVGVLVAGGSAICLLAGCAGAQEYSGTISLSLLGLWLAGFSLAGTLTGCGVGGGGGGVATTSAASSPAAGPAVGLRFVTVAQTLNAEHLPLVAAGSAQALTVLDPAPQVEAIDANGNRATSYTGPVTVSLATAPPGATLLGTATRNAVDGLVTFDDLRVSLSGTFSLSAVAGKLRQALSDSSTATELPLGFTQSVYNVGNQAQFVLAANIDGDTRPDLVCVNSSDHTLSVLLGKGQGKFNLPTTVAVAGLSGQVAAGDIDRDGKTDLVVATYNGLGTGVSVLLGKGDGTFKAATNPTTGLLGHTLSVLVGDFNGDSFDDVVVASYNGQGAVLLGNGDGTFQAALNVASINQVRTMASADLDKDGKPDIVCANAAFARVLLGNGKGAFTATGPFLSMDAPQGSKASIVCADINNDGNVDLIANDANASDVRVCLGNGDGTFQAVTTFATPAATASVAVRDMNADGVPDIVASCPTDGSLSVLLGNGDGSFKAAQTFKMATTPGNLCTVDVNADGRIDIVTANGSSNTLSVMKHD